MSETKWTPGPWTSHGNTVESVRAHYCSTLIATTSMAPHFENAEHNARLIAAAPELFEALEECKRVLSDLQSTNQEGTRTRNAWDKARAALAKARGE